MEAISTASTEVLEVVAVLDGDGCHDLGVEEEDDASNHDWLPTAESEDTEASPSAKEEKEGDIDAAARE